MHTLYSHSLYIGQTIQFQRQVQQRREIKQKEKSSTNQRVRIITAVCTIQRVFRGHRGRKFAMR